MDLREAVKSSKSLAEVLRRIGLVPAGGNYATLKARITKEEIDTSHFSGQAWRKGGFFSKRPLDDYLNNRHPIKSDHLKKRLFAEGLLERRCGECKLTTWVRRPIPLELHHKNGDRKDNRLLNLDVLCPNCHSLTDSFRGRNIARMAKR